MEPPRDDGLLDRLRLSLGADRHLEKGDEPLVARALLHARGGVPSLRARPRVVTVPEDNRAALLGANQQPRNAVALEHGAAHGLRALAPRRVPPVMPHRRVPRLALSHGQLHPLVVTGSPLWNSHPVHAAHRAQSLDASILDAFFLDAFIFNAFIFHASFLNGSFPGEVPELGRDGEVVARVVGVIVAEIVVKHQVGPALAVQRQPRAQLVPFPRVRVAHGAREERLAARARCAGRVAVGIPEGDSLHVAEVHKDGARSEVVPVVVVVAVDEPRPA
mmetsp:Transcript_1410/g.6335  ORF Transcript_1410/g.6335 Transcript_1410/m.6335 type:complete len:276 (+) Transcript_1410:2495-3322(+)